MKKLFLLLAMVGMIFTACEPANGLDEDNNGNPTEQPDNGGNQGGNDNTGGEDNPDNPGGGNQGGEDAVFIVTPTSCSVPASGGTISLTLKYDVEDDYLQCGWCDEAGNEIDWIELIDARSKTMHLTFSVAGNTSSNKRIGYIVLYDAKNDKYQGVAVEQEGKQNEEEVVFFVTPTSCTVPASGGKVSLTLKYDVEDDYLQCGLCDESENQIDWIELVATRTNTMYLTFSVAENTSSNKRIGYIILYDAKNNKEQKVTVTQEGKQNVVFEVSPSAITMSADGGVQDITVNTNIDYNVGCSASWVSCTKTTTGVKVTVEKSTSSQERTAEIKFTNTSYNVSKVVKVTQSGAVNVDANCVIYYTSSDGKIVKPYRPRGDNQEGDGLKSDKELFGANIVSNTYNNGQGILLFDAPVTTIGYGAFTWQPLTEYEDITGSGYRLTSIVIPNSVTSIGEAAFCGCRFLADITIGNNITSIGNKAFIGCISMTSIAIPDSVTSIGDDAFNGCSSLTSITIPNAVTEIGGSAFAGCTSLTSVTIGNSVTSIGDEAFLGCESLKSINIPNSVTFIGYRAFLNCSGELIIENKFIEKDYTSSNCPISYLCWLDGSNFTKITIGNNITSIGDYAFCGCTSLASVAIPNSVTSIGERAFYNCYSLTSVTIPDSVTSIGSEAFEYCSSLTSVYCKPTTPPAGDSSMFYRNASGRKIYVPTESVDAYKAASGWSSYKSYIVGYDF